MKMEEGHQQIWLASGQERQAEVPCILERVGTPSQLPPRQAWWRTVHGSGNKDHPGSFTGPATQSLTHLRWCSVAIVVADKFYFKAVSFLPTELHPEPQCIKPVSAVVELGEVGVTCQAMFICWEQSTFHSVKEKNEAQHPSLST